MSSDKDSEILRIIQKLTTTGGKTLDENLMKNLKKICKESNDFVNYAYYALMTQLRKEHSEIRYSTLLIINELYNRSPFFRGLLEKDMAEFLELVVETNLDNPLPLPKQAAKELRLKGLEFIQAWTSKYGERYGRLRLALNFLKNCKKVEFGDMAARSVAEREQQRREQERQERILNEKINKVREEMQDTRYEISSALTQMENCFQLMIPHTTEDLFSSQDFEISEPAKFSGDCEMEDVDTSSSNSNHKNKSYSSNSLRQHGIYDMKKTITIEVPKNSETTVKVNEDTQPIIENLNDLYKQMGSGYLPIVSRWLKILTKGSNCTDTLKQAIDLKQLIESSLEKYRELKIQTNLPASNESDDEDDFIEVKEKEGFESEAFNEPRSFAPKPSSSRELSAVEKACMWKLRHSEEDIKDPTSAVSTLLKRISEQPKLEMSSTSVSPEIKVQTKNHKAELLEKAPVLPYDIDLFHWEEEKLMVPEVVKFDSLHNFWESAAADEDNEILKEEQIASLRTRKIDFSGKFEPVKYSCRAPLPSGKLCPRKDRYKCPFHGKIVKRDSAGNPIDVKDIPSTSNEPSASVPEWQDPALLRDIEAATGINLKLPEKRVKGKKKEKNPKTKSGLTNVKHIQTSARDRLSKKIIKRYKHCSKKLDDIDRKLFNDKFGDQWNYY